MNALMLQVTPFAASSFSKISWISHELPIEVRSDGSDVGAPDEHVGVVLARAAGARV